MLKDRGFLIGLGAGLIVGALLLQLSLGVRNANNKALNPAATANLSEQDIRKMAEDKGLAVTGKKELDDLKAKAAATASGSATPAPKASETPKPSVSPSVSPSASPSGGASAAPSADTSVLRIFIADGMGSKEVAAYLAEVGVIVDKAAFEQRIKERGVESKLKKGTYLLKPNMKANDVINTLTGTSD